MTIYLGADHRGFALKGPLIAFVQGMGYEVSDLGAKTLVPGDDYPDYAAEVARRVDADPEQNKGILICGAGAGVDIVANRFRKVRSVLGMNPDQVYAARHDDDANVLSLAADHVTEEVAKQMVKVFLVTPFSADARFSRRLDKIDAVILPPL